jgi:hypothetical protein
MVIYNLRAVTRASGAPVGAERSGGLMGSRSPSTSDRRARSSRAELARAELE